MSTLNTNSISSTSSFNTTNVQQLVTNKHATFRNVEYSINISLLNNDTLIAEVEEVPIGDKWKGQFSAKCMFFSIHYLILDYEYHDASHMICYVGEYAGRDWLMVISLQFSFTSYHHLAYLILQDILYPC